MLIYCCCVVHLCLYNYNLKLVFIYIFGVSDCFTVFENPSVEQENLQYY